MSIIKSLIIAFSLYSKIPMPQFEWKDEDLRYVTGFFPVVGAAVGGMFYLWFYIAETLNLPGTSRCFILAALPLIITGGFHFDGFLDTSDALSSYGDKEKKREILKDPHIGAFAFIRGLIAAAIYVAALFMAEDEKAALAIAGGFVLSRALSALAVLCFPKMSDEGNVSYISKRQNDKINLVLILMWMALSIAFELCNSVIIGVTVIAAALISFIYYRFMSQKQFGGISGDLAGYFVVICEIMICVFAGVFSFAMA
ncbi:MAG: adenosylcobinamide-GDP ribazoletransferase [Eubacterium sp.]|nr:adenosylcobinamide-GDP ribazoletransferase [Eubacterium sp.]